MRTYTIVVVAAALALGGCKKDDKGADSKTTKADQPAAVDKDKPAAGKPAAPPTPDAAPAAVPAVASPADAAAAAAAPAAPSGDTITLAYVPPPVGAIYTVEKTQTMDLTIHAQGQTAPMTAHKLERQKIEVLATTPDAITKAKVTYEAVEESQAIAGKEQAKPSPLVGKTYVLEAGTPIAVTTDAGPAPAAEADAVRDAEKTFGKPEKMSTLLKGKTFTKDQPLDLPPAEIAHSFGDDPTMVVKKMTLTFTGMDGALANFELAMALGQDMGGNSLMFELVGPVTIEPATGEATAMELTGKVTMTGQASAEGTMTMTRKVTR